MLIFLVGTQIRLQACSFMQHNSAEGQIGCWPAGSRTGAVCMIGDAHVCVQDAAEARVEARRVRAELAVSEAERVELTRRARQLVRRALSFSTVMVCMWVLITVTTIDSSSRVLNSCPVRYIEDDWMDMCQCWGV